MKYEPHKYQEYATDFVETHPISALFLDCGLGKSIITLTALWTLLLDSFDVRKVLIIAPLRVARDTWSAELEKWDHLDGLVLSKILGTPKERKLALLKRANLYIINRENVGWLVDNCYWDFDMIVIDELSSFKSGKTQRFRALRKMRARADRIIGLTGTPTPNGLIDLWAEIGLLDMGERLGRYLGKYREKFFLPDKRNREIIYSYKPKENAEKEIYELIGDICISMKSVDYLDMPELLNNRVEVSMDEKEMALYQKMECDMLLPFENAVVDAVNAAAHSGKLLQMANGAVYDEYGGVKHIHDRKLDALEDLIEAANGKSVLVVYWFKHDLTRIQERFQCRKLDTSKDISDWNEGKIPVAVVHPASVGHGLNLQSGGSILIWFGMTWSLELYQQMNDRLWRQGQKETVIVHHILTRGTVDMDVMASLERKDSGQEALKQAVKARIGGIADASRDHVQRL